MKTRSALFRRRALEVGGPWTFLKIRYPPFRIVRMLTVEGSVDAALSPKEQLVSTTAAEPEATLVNPTLEPQRVM